MIVNRICSKCVMTESTPGISFDDEGVCNYCRVHTTPELQPEERLMEILESSKARDKKYDCMVGLSGGRDSTYTLLKLVRDYRMKALAVTYDNPFMSKQARDNIEKALGILNVDCVTWRFPDDAHRRFTRKHLRIWAKHPSSIMIPFVCAHCKSWWPEFFKVACDNDISLIVIGSNPLETASFKKAGLGGARTYHRVSNLPKILGRSIKEIMANPRYLTTNWIMVLKMYLGASHSTPYMKWRYKDIKVVRFFDYFRWIEKEVESTITRDLGWQKSSEVVSSWRFDCRLDYVRRLMYVSTTGVTELRDLLSKMIRENQITRETALERLSKEESISEHLIEEVLSDLGLRLSDLNLRFSSSLLVE